mmetsp:Transcript_24399/g.63615  ORF Transcript_24399/g.63615 Transcript_24399/m.63615 type:complete len:461 (-) Transcript_24399:48-1430(-)
MERESPPITGITTPPIWAVLGLATLVRAALVPYGEWHDLAYPSLPYTDVDYAVFTAGARHLVAGASPYDCETYRYPPILAVLMVPNLWVHPAAGKVLFCGADLMVGWLIWALVTPAASARSGGGRGIVSRDQPKGSVEAGSAVTLSAEACAALWLFNPLTAAISTRGNAEAVVSAAVLTTLWLLQRGRTTAAGVGFGLAVHLKLYPIIYAIPTLVTLGPKPAGRRHPSPGGRATGSLSVGRTVVATVRREITPARVEFVVGAAASLTVMTGVSFAAYGWPFLWQTYLYHFVRADHRHNFSPYFLPVYLTADPTDAVDPAGMSMGAKAIGLAALIPQAGLVLYAGVRCADDLPFAWLLQSMIFVMFNKVCTSQYFVWVLCLIPVAAPTLGLSVRQASLVAAVWAGGQALWLQAAYRLEGLGQGNFIEVWACGVALLLIHAWCVRVIAESHGQYTHMHRTQD